jgi:hypothetical protein
MKQKLSVKSHNIGLIMFILSAMIFEASFNKEISDGYTQDGKICVTTESTKLPFKLPCRVKRS